MSCYGTGLNSYIQP